MQHITEKELDLLQYFYEKKKGHVRQIKKAVHLSEHTLLKYLSSLQKRNMLSLRSEGNLKIYEVHLKSPFIKVFFSYFDLKRVQTLDYKREKTITLFVERIKKVKMPYFVLLFGSTAKGNYLAKSDIDCIVVFDSFEKEVNKRIEGIKKDLFAETGLRMNSIIMGLDEFRREKENPQNYALQDAFLSGYPIFGNQMYYEVIFS